MQAAGCNSAAVESFSSKWKLERLVDWQIYLGMILLNKLPGTVESTWYGKIWEYYSTGVFLKPQKPF